MGPKRHRRCSATAPRGRQVRERASAGQGGRALTSTRSSAVGGWLTGQECNSQACPVVRLPRSRLCQLCLCGTALSLCARTSPTTLNGNNSPTTRNGRTKTASVLTSSRSMILRSKVQAGRPSRRQSQHPYLPRLLGSVAAQRERTDKDPSRLVYQRWLPRACLFGLADHRQEV